MTRLSRPSEADVQRQITDYLTLSSWLVLRVNSGAVTGEYTDRHGTTRRRFVEFVRCSDPTLAVPDVLAFRDARMLAIECKRPGWKPPKPPGPDAKPKTRQDYERYQRQRRFLERWIEVGGEAGFVTSLEEVVEMVERRKKVA